MNDDRELRFNAGDDDPAWWEGFVFRWDEDELTIEAIYDSGCAALVVSLDAVQVQQLRDLLA